MLAVNISPSLLEQYRICYQGLYNKSDKDVVDYIRDDFVITPIIAEGTAFHQILEDGPEPYRIGGLRDGAEPTYQVFSPELRQWFYFTSQEVAPLLEYRAQYPDMVYECKTKLWWQNVAGYNIHMSMKIDGLHGLDLHEQKTTQSRYKPTTAKYKQSMQWRCYLAALPESSRILYNVFHIKRPKRGPAHCVPYQYIFHRYPGMIEDCRRYLEGLLRFCETRGLIEDLRPEWIKKHDDHTVH